VSSVFSSLHESLQQVLAQRFDWSELREVQEEACRTIRKGGDALIIAPTAGGKSEAALIPVMDDILNHGRPGITCLYISPLKALINDQEENLERFRGDHQEMGGLTFFPGAFTPGNVTVPFHHGE
jgi:ATP-dependent Lhr-like helicase